MKIVLLRVILLSIFGVNCKISWGAKVSAFGESDPSESLDSLRVYLNTLTNRLENSKSLEEFFGLGLGAVLEDYKKAHQKLVLELNTKIHSIPGALDDSWVQNHFTKIIVKIGIQIQQIQANSNELDREAKRFRDAYTTLGKTFWSQYFEYRQNWSPDASELRHSEAALKVNSEMNSLISNIPENLHFLEYWEVIKDDFMADDPLTFEIRRFEEDLFKRFGKLDSSETVTEIDFLSVFEGFTQHLNSKQFGARFTEVFGFAEVSRFAQGLVLTEAFEKYFPKLEFKGSRLEFFKKLFSRVSAEQFVRIWDYLKHEGHLLVAEKEFLARQMVSLSHKWWINENFFKRDSLTKRFAEISAELSPIRPVDFLFKIFSENPKLTENPENWLRFYQAIPFASKNPSYNEYERVLRLDFLKRLSKFIQESKAEKYIGNWGTVNSEVVHELNKLSSPQLHVFDGKCAYWARWMLGL